MVGIKPPSQTRFWGVLLPIFIKMSFPGKIRCDKICLDLFGNIREMFSIML